MDQPHGQAIVLLSDGIPNSDGGAARVLQSARLAKAMESPIYTHVFGSSENRTNIAIELATSQDLAVPGQKVLLRASVTHSAIANGSTTVTLLLDGAPVDRCDVLLDSTGRSPVSFPILAREDRNL